uniref:Uncharacterized protein n=1 Tax=Strigamia maritima TaxID=126957 RepID=T1J7A7_STRMM
MDAVSNFTSRVTFLFTNLIGCDYEIRHFVQMAPHTLLTLSKLARKLHLPHVFRCNEEKKNDLLDIYYSVVEAFTCDETRVNVAISMLMKENLTRR